MKNRLIMPIVVGLTFAQPLQALQTYKMVDQQKTTVVLSKDSYTRIAVLDDRIQQIFGADGVFDIQSDDERGQIFLKPLTHDSSKAVSITIVTEAGVTQDILLIPKKVEAQSILFQVEGDQKNTPLKEKSYRTQLAELMEAMLYSNTLDDYDKMPLKTTDRLPVENIEVAPVFIYRGNNFSGRVYTVSNNSSNPINLNEQMFAQVGDVALLLWDQTLGSEQTTSLFVISKEEQ